MTHKNDIVYKIRHKPTGLFYKPEQKRYGVVDDQLVSKGKIYKLYPAQALENVRTYGAVYKAEVMLFRPDDWAVDSYRLVRIGSTDVSPEGQE